MLTEKYYTIKEVADLLKVSYMTVFRWVKAGKLKSVKAGKQHRVSKLALNEYLKQNNS